MRTAVFVACVAFISVSAPTQAGWDDGYWFLEFDSGTSTTAPPIRVGVDLGDGSGFSFQTIPDHDGDGTIWLPLVPVGGRLALGADTASTGPILQPGDFSVYEFLGGDTTVGSTKQKPLLVIAEDVEGESLAVDYGNFAEPPFSLTPGERYTVVDGRVTAWPEPRLVNNFGVPGLEEFVQTVDSLPNFSGDVIVSTEMLIGTFFIPEPTALTTTLLAVLTLLSPLRRRH